MRIAALGLRRDISRLLRDAHASSASCGPGTMLVVGGPYTLDQSSLGGMQGVINLLAAVDLTW